MTFRVLVLGGYGQFGRRIVEALAGDAEMTVIVAGRDALKATALCDALRPMARALEAETIDIMHAFDEALCRVGRIWSSRWPDRSRRRDTTSPVRRWASARMTRIRGWACVRRSLRCAGRDGEILWAMLITGASSYPASARR